MFVLIPAANRLKSRVSFLTSVDPFSTTPKSMRISMQERKTLKSPASYIHGTRRVLLEQTDTKGASGSALIVSEQRPGL